MGNRNATGKPTDNKLTNRCIIIFRYNEEASRMLGAGKTPPIEVFAKKLGELILRVQELVCKNEKNGVSKDAFRCYLVAHSMGGLVCRAFLQNPENDPKKAARLVDKLFTYARERRSMLFTSSKCWPPLEVNSGILQDGPPRRTR